MSLMAAACGSGPRTNVAAGHSAPAAVSPPPSASSTAPVIAAHDDADVMFARSMVPDDQQAIQMSDIVLGKQDVDQRIIDLAGQIKIEQGPQVDQLTGWLSGWGNPPMPSSSGGEISGDGSGTPPAIAGMMSDDDLDALKSAQGPDAGPTYLGEMVGHEAGAVAMARDEITGGRFPGAVQLARSVVATDKQNVDLMRNLLSHM
jgi:uncharacterized protein (DUF305 family)